MASPRFYRPYGGSPLGQEEEEPGLVSQGLHRLGAIAGTAGRGIDTLVNVGRGLIEEGDPLARFKLTPESQGRGLAGDVGAALGFSDPSIDQETVGQQVAYGAFGAPSKEDSYGRAIGREVAHFAGDLARDPLTFVAGVGLGQKAPMIEKGATRLFQGMMAGGAYEGGKAAWETTQREGFTPHAAAQATGAALSGAALVLPHLRSRRGMTPEELNTVQKILPNATIEELGKRMDFYKARGMDEAFRAVEDELNRRNQILPKDSQGRISQSARPAFEAAEEFRLAEEPFRPDESPVMDTWIGPTPEGFEPRTPIQPVLDQIEAGGMSAPAGPPRLAGRPAVRYSPEADLVRRTEDALPVGLDETLRAATSPELQRGPRLAPPRPAFMERLQALKSPEEATALIDEQTQSLLAAAQKAGIPVPEEARALPTYTGPSGEARSLGPLEGDVAAPPRGDEGGMGVEETAPPVPPGVPAVPSPVGDRGVVAPETVKLPAERLLWERAVEAGVPAEQAAKLIQTASGRALLRQAAMGPREPMILPEGEKRLPAWEGKLFDPTRAPEARPEVIARQAEAIAAAPEDAQVFADAARVVETADARRLARQQRRAEAKARKRELSRARAEELLAQHQPQRLPLVPEAPSPVSAPVVSPEGAPPRVEAVVEQPPSPEAGTTQPKYSVTPDGRAEIERLRRENADALATPLMSEGGLSPAQLGMMSKRQQEQYQERVARRLDVEQRIRDLERTPEQVAQAEQKAMDAATQAKLLQIDRAIEDLNRVGGGAGGKLRPKYQREVDRLMTERSALTGRAAVGSSGTPPNALTLETVQANFKGRQVDATESGFLVTLPSGKRIRVENTGEITFTPEALERGHGKAAVEGVATGEQRIAGSYQRVGPEAVIRVAEEGVLPHEVLHAFVDNVASPKERRLLEQQYRDRAKTEGRDWEEVAADDYKDYFHRRRTAEAEGKTVQEKGLFERLWAKMYEFFRSAYRTILPNKEWIQEQLYAGKPWERGGSPAVMAQDKAALAYHGSPHKFDRFDSSKIGTGEGNQSFGHGLYFAENPTVAKEYQRRLSGYNSNARYRINGAEVTDPLTRFVAASVFERGKAETVRFFRATAKEELSNGGRLTPDHEPGWFARAAEIAAGLDKRSIEREQGHFYKVDIPDDQIAKMMDWHRPLSEQPEVLEAFDRAGLPKEFILKNRLTGEGAYQSLASRSAAYGVKNTEAYASALLLAEGVPGIKYYDQGSRASGAGTRNFVLFNDQTPTIITNEKYSIQPTSPQTPAPGVHEATTAEKVVEGYKAGILSGPGTQVANIAGGGAEQGVRAGETQVAAFVDSLLPGERVRFGGEARAELKGLFSKMPEAFGQLGKDLKDTFALAPETPDPTAPIERRHGAIGGKMGRAVRVPFRLLQAFDNFFGTIGKQAEIEKLAYRQAKLDLRGADEASIKARAKELAQNPTEGILKEAERAKASRLFKSDPENPDELIQALINLRKKYKALEVVLPFIEAPANIAKLIVQRSPLGFAQAAKAYRVYKAAVKKGADTATVQKLRGEAVDAIARPLLGSVLLGSFYAYAKGGGMTGSGPTDQRQKSLLRQTGWQPYSFVVGDGERKVYVPFNRFEPLSSFLGFAADAAESKDSKNAEEMVNKAMGSIVSNLTSKTYLQGVADAAEFINNPSRFASSYLSSVSSAAVPNIVAKAAQAIDPTVRDVTPESAGIAGLPERIGNTLLSRIPGASTTLPARRTATGEPIQREGTAVTRFLSPVQPSARRPEARLEELMVEAGQVPGQPSREFTIPGSGGKKIRLTDSEYAVLQEANQNAAELLRARVPTLERMDPEARAKIIQQTYDRAREYARSRLMRNSAFRSRARQQMAVA